MRYSIHASSASTVVRPTEARAPRRSRPWQALAGLALLSVLTSCDDDNGYCYNCGITPFEVSQGVVAGNFNGSGFPSIIALNSNEPETGAFPDDLKVYLSTAAGSYASPVYVPDGSEPLYVASADLNGDGPPDVVSASFDDGALAVFLNNKAKWTTKGAIYDPVKNVWTPVAPPAGWTTIGDAQSVVLPNGTFMLANCCDAPPQAALLNATTLTWKILNSTSGYKNKNDNNDEEGWTLLPDGKVLTIDTYWSVPYNPTAKNSEIYDPVAGSWSSAGNTVQQLWDSRAACGKKTSNETGNAVLMPNGTVFATGANSCLDSDSDGTAGHTALYDTATGVWTAGPDIPGGNDVADGPAALLPNGHVWSIRIRATAITPALSMSLTGRVSSRRFPNRWA